MTTFRNIVSATISAPGAAPAWLQGAFEYWRAGGPLMPFIALVTFVYWYRYLAVLLCLREMLANADESLPVSAAVSDADGRRRIRGAVPRIAVRVRRAVAEGISLDEAFDQARAAETGTCNWAFYVLGALVTVAPLLGLLGTVLGMITTFNAVAVGSEATGRQVASGISQALITTQAGLVSALAGTFGLAHLFRLYRRLQHAVERLFSHLTLYYRNAAPAAGTPACELRTIPDADACGRK